TQADGSGTHYDVGSVFTVDVADACLYAVWTLNDVYTVTFMNGSAIYATKTVVSPATTIDALPANPTKGSYSFSGWYTGTGGSGTKFTASTTVTANMTVYAHWRSDSSGPTPSVVYHVIDHFGEWTGSGTATAKVDAPYSKFIRLLYNGSAVSAGNYSEIDGYTVLTLNEDYLETFADGTYTFRAEFQDGYADIVLTVNAEGDDITVPQTGDDNNMIGWIVVMLICIFVIICVLAWLKWRQA
ncbi:MAG: InlB B-repeat-containing protein, partial [Methanomassiliicoccaceae archaeon]|nr:InlB B-repeat-containing protein [Methanomassiliicoccaceae archaeon]